MYILIKSLAAALFSFITHAAFCSTWIFHNLRRSASYFITQSAKKALTFRFFSFLDIFWHYSPHALIFTLLTFSLDYAPVSSAEDDATYCPDSYAIIIKPHLYVRCEDFDYYHRTKDESVLFMWRPKHGN